MVVWVQSEFLVFAEALGALLNSMGIDTVLQGDAPAEVALRDLNGIRPPFPPPREIPTVAIVRSDERDMVALIRQQYRGYIRSTDDRDTLRLALEAVRRGEIWAERRILTMALHTVQDPELTSRESEILRCLARGMSNRGIAMQLSIAEGTVKMHVSRVYSKLGVRSRSELLAKVLRQP